MVLPRNLMCASPQRENHLETMSLLPVFPLPRACMGIVAKFFLGWKGSGNEFRREVARVFPCCVQPIQDLQIACAFWEELRRCVSVIARPLGATDLMMEMQEASKMLNMQR